MSNQSQFDRRASRGRGRPKLGVVGREVTLLPHHWNWLNERPGGASVALRELVEAARRSEPPPLPATPRPARVPKPAVLLPAGLGQLVPTDKQHAVRRCLDVALGSAAIEAAVRLPGGAAGAAIVIRLTARAANRPRETDYLMRIEGPPSPFHDTRRQYACLRIAAAAHVAPILLHADADAGIAISEFLQPMAPADLPTRADRIRAILESLKRLHAAPLFPPCMPYVDVIDSLLGQCRATGILDMDAVREHLTLYARLAAGYRRLAPDTVSSHNDLNPSNILFARHRAWLVDWESAFAADRYVDLAALTNFYAVNAYDEEMVLRIYFGPQLTDEHRARAFLMQQLNRLFYALVLLNGAAAARPQTRLSGALLAATPRFSEVRGELGSLATPAGRLRFGCVFLNEMKWNLQSPRFAEALGLLAPAG
jgi:thiamine kinase-like enzyme